MRPRASRQATLRRRLRPSRGAAPAEPEMIEVWRPGRPPGERQPRDGERRRRRRRERPLPQSRDGQALPTMRRPRLRHANDQQHAGGRSRSAAPASAGSGAAVRGIAAARTSERRATAASSGPSGPRRREQARPQRPGGDDGQRQDGRAPPRRDRDRDRRDDNRPSRTWSSIRRRAARSPIRIRPSPSFWR